MTTEEKIRELKKKLREEQLIERKASIAFRIKQLELFNQEIPISFKFNHKSTQKT